MVTNLIKKIDNTKFYSGLFKKFMLIFENKLLKFDKILDL